MNLDIRVRPVGPRALCPRRPRRHAAQPNGGQGRIDVCGVLPAVGTAGAWRWHGCGRCILCRRNRSNQASAAKLPVHEAGCHRDGVEPQSGPVCCRKLHAVSRPARMLKAALMKNALRPALRPALGYHVILICLVAATCNSSRTWMAIRCCLASRCSLRPAPVALPSVLSRVLAI
jgi:hypothetical protein